MICFEFKGGIGTASRVLPAARAATRSACWCRRTSARRHQLRVAGVPVGQEIGGGTRGARGETGSIIIVVATDAPLLPHQLKRLARRAALGLARTGSVAGNGSGDIFLAFSTANPDAGDGEGPVAARRCCRTTAWTAVRGDRGRDRGGDRQRAGRRPRP